MRKVQSRTLTWARLREVAAGLKATKAISGDPRAAYALALNEAALQPHLDAVADADKPAPEYEAFTKAQVALYRRLGVPEGANGIRVPDERKDEFNADLAALREEHGAAIAAEDERRTAFRAMAEGEGVDVELRMIALASLPDPMPFGLVACLTDMIDEGDE